MPALTHDTMVTVTAVDGSGRRSSASASIALTTPQADLIIDSVRDESGQYQSTGPFIVSANYDPGPPSGRYGTTTLPVVPQVR